MPSSPPIQSIWIADSSPPPPMAPLICPLWDQFADPFWIFDSSYQAPIDNPIPLLQLLSLIDAPSHASSFLALQYLSLLDYLCPLMWVRSSHLKLIHHLWFLYSAFSALDPNSSSSMATLGASSSYRGKEVVQEVDSTPPTFVIQPSKSVPNRSFLLARILGAKQITSARCFFQAMKSSWLPEGTFDHAQLDDNLFLFSFSEHKDVERIVEGSPWEYDFKWVILKPVSSLDQFLSVPLTEVCVTARLHDLPFDFRDNGNVIGIANSVGLRVISIAELNGCNNYVKFRCWINVNKPLVDKVQLPTLDGQILTLLFTYENLPTFCYFCGVLGHGFRHCAKWNQADNEAIALPYSDSLRAVDFGQKYTPPRSANGRRLPPHRSPARVSGGQGSLIGARRGGRASPHQLRSEGQRSHLAINGPLLDQVLSQVKELLIGTASNEFNDTNGMVLQCSKSDPPSTKAHSPTRPKPLSHSPELGLQFGSQARRRIPGLGLLGAGPVAASTQQANPSSNFTTPNSPITPIAASSSKIQQRSATPYPILRGQTSPPASRSPDLLHTSTLAVQEGTSDGSKKSLPLAAPTYSPIRRPRGLSSPDVTWSPRFDEADADEVAGEADPAVPVDSSTPADGAAGSLFHASLAISPVPGRNGYAFSPMPPGSPSSITLFPFSNSKLNKGGFQFTAVGPKERGCEKINPACIEAVNSVLNFDFTSTNLKRSAAFVSDLDDQPLKKKSHSAGSVILERYSRNKIRTKSKAYNKKVNPVSLSPVAGRTPSHQLVTVSSVAEDSPIEVPSSPRPEAEVALQPRLDQ